MIQIARIKEHEDNLTSMELTDDKRLISLQLIKLYIVYDSNNCKFIERLEGLIN